jgi:hypothetical protein
MQMNGCQYPGRFLIIFEGWSSKSLRTNLHTLVCVDFIICTLREGGYVSGEYSTHRRDEKCIQNFGRET